jgi:hypothetical protein
VISCAGNSGHDGGPSLICLALPVAPAGPVVP